MQLDHGEKELLSARCRKETDYLRERQRQKADVSAFKCHQGKVDFSSTQRGFFDLLE